jgi:hypothetical protein
LANDGLDREFKFFYELKAGVCTTCAPGDQEKSCDSQCEEAFWSEAAPASGWRTCATEGFGVAHKKFLPNSADIPPDLIRSVNDGDVIFRCGAGVSLGAGLPTFKKLTDDVYTSIGESRCLPIPAGCWRKICAAFRSHGAQRIRQTVRWSFWRGTEGSRLSIDRDQTYETYMAILLAVSAEHGKSVLEIEMILFGQANQLCDAALPLLKNRELT